MHRAPLLALLDRYAIRFPDERDTTTRIRSLVESHSDCFLRTCVPGHITASAWIVSHDHRDALLTHHKKLDRWLQLGGHADGETDSFGVALREAREESGMQHFTCLPLPEFPAPLPEPFDLDVHMIPGRPGEPAHEHHDVRYLLVAAPGQALICSDESTELAWFGQAELDDLLVDESLLRLLRKSRALLLR